VLHRYDRARAGVTGDAAWTELATA
jgi:hypothetical protein